MKVITDLYIDENKRKKNFSEIFVNSYVIIFYIDRTLCIKHLLAFCKAFYM